METSIKSGQFFSKSKLFKVKCPTYGVPALIRKATRGTEGHQVCMCTTRARLPCDEACLSGMQPAT